MECLRDCLSQPCKARLAIQQNVIWNWINVLPTCEITDIWHLLILRVLGLNRERPLILEKMFYNYLYKTTHLPVKQQSNGKNWMSLSHIFNYIIYKALCKLSLEFSISYIYIQIRFIMTNKMQTSLCKIVPLLKTKLQYSEKSKLKQRLDKQSFISIYFCLFRSLNQHFRCSRIMDGKTYVQLR